MSDKADEELTDKSSASQRNNRTGNTMWGGRFAEGPAAIMQEINASIGVDKRLWREDIAGSRAHATMLAATKIISADDLKAIEDGLDSISEEIESGRFPFSAELEDIHMNIEARLKELIGTPASRIHTARSRNDQVATDFRIWVREACIAMEAALSDLMAVMASRAVEHAETIMPGFTHLQTAQPITFGHHCLAYVEMFARDRDRIKDARLRLNECPLGAAALAGTSFPIDRHQTAEILGFDRPTANSLDSVSARDFALEVIGALNIASMHLSRLSEEIVIWSSAPFHFVQLPDSFSTGSSIMPQKRNPDAAELIRAKVGQMAGAFVHLLIMMKGLPLAYAKDMQEDKAATFRAVDDFALCVAAMSGMMTDMKINETAMYEAASGGHATATDLADWLVRVLNMPFRDAHHVTGRLVALADEKSCRLDELSLSDMVAIEPKITENIFDILSVDASVRSRQSFGGTAPNLVKASANLWLDRLNESNQ